MAYSSGLSTAVASNLVGTVAVVDLEAACEQYGRDELPYPLGRTRPVGSVWLATRDVEPIDDRLEFGDLRGVRSWVEAWFELMFASNADRVIAMRTYPTCDCMGCRPAS